MSKLGKPRQNKTRPLTTAEAMELSVGKGWEVKTDHDAEDGIVLYRDGEIFGQFVPNVKRQLKKDLIAYWTGGAKKDVHGFRLTEEQWQFCSRQYGGASAFVRRLIDREKAQAESMADEDERRRQGQAGVEERLATGVASD